ncbi:MAG: sigma-70 family RNA polymerase sigma factor [Phycisphaerales bacterium]|nr:sigma-70 family RNA polymerase sigma factor [Phycisphaerales bacterium]
MRESHQKDVTRLLREAREGGIDARKTLWDAIYEELKAIATHHMRAEGNGRTIQATALVHEAWMRLVDPSEGWENRVHFFGAVAHVMREILVDDARRRVRLKRGGNRRRVDSNLVDLQITASSRDPIEVLAVNEAIEELRRLSERQADVIVCRYFAGMTVKETADSLGIASRTVQADSALAAAWLRRELGDQG